LYDCSSFVKFSLTASLTPTLSGPSTNWPIWCRICHLQQPEAESHRQVHDTRVIWSYNMPAHIEEKHAGQEISEDFEKEYVITWDEMIHLKILKGQLDRPPVKRAAKRNAGELEDVPKGKKAWK
jgi:hypothetical protein